MNQAVADTFRIYISRIINWVLWATGKKYGPSTNKFGRGYTWMKSITLKTSGMR
jgi:hypothetical protein